MEESSSVNEQAVAELRSGQSDLRAKSDRESVALQKRLELSAKDRTAKKASGPAWVSALVASRPKAYSEPFPAPVDPTLAPG